MKAEFRTQFPFGGESQRLSRLFREIVNKNCWKEITGVFAYATAGGLTDLLDQISLLSNSPKTKWLFGLDDCLTEPSAIELARSCSEDVRVVSLMSQKRRFHPKLLHFAGSDENYDVLVVGSANLTSNGLNQNAEAVSILSAPSSSEAATISQTIAKLFELGYAPTELQLALYREAYTKARPLHKQIGKLGVNENESNHQTAERSSPGLDPTVATCCWIEVGKNTAMGRELEIKSEQAVFFRLFLGNGAKQSRTFILHNGNEITLNFKYQARNAMWRLQLRSEVPEVRRGLRPVVNGRLERSTLVAVFNRVPNSNSFELLFIEEESKKYSDIREESLENGSSGATSARRYGWF